MLIRALQPDDIPAAMRLKEAAGWNQTEDDWRNVLRLAPGGCFGLVENDTLAATATAVSYGTDLGWIGMVLTHPDFRGRGFARALMEHALDYLSARGVRCVKLDATDMGYPLYRNLGFEDECPVERWRRSAGPIGPESACPFVIDVALDRAGISGGSDRTAGPARASGSASVPGGFALGRPGALAVLWAVRRQQCGSCAPPVARIPLRTFAAGDFLGPVARERGSRQTGSGVRLRAGSPAHAHGPGPPVCAAPRRSPCICDRRIRIRLTNDMRKLSFWKLRTREIRLGERTVILGVLNVTPDSFSDGGKYQDPDRALARAIEMEEEGADVIDIGAESTRPGSSRISAAEELRRLVPVLKRLKGKLTLPISVDTYKSEVAELAIEHGAEIINDPSGLTFEPQLARTVANHDAGLILNHMRGRPEAWAKLPPLPDVMGTILRDLDATVQPRAAFRCGSIEDRCRSGDRFRQAQGAERGDPGAAAAARTTGTAHHDGTIAQVLSGSFH